MILTPRGTKDVTPNEAYKWHYIENVARETARLFSLKEIRTPVFEYTELFERGVGETTDVVNKEMYTFLDRSERSITLKPEGTAGVARSYIEHGMHNLPQPIKMFYISPIFRFEKPQSGRLREHHQFGVEIFGSEDYITDVETINIANTFFNKLSLDNLALNINSIGCPKCRPKYNEALVKYLSGQKDLCPTCKERTNKNPLRVLDCKVPECNNITKNAPIILDYLCPTCKEHHENVCKGLKKLKIKYEINPYIVRGLDYYTRTVFEFISNDIGSQSTVCGGGRYDGLVESLGGKATPAVGFGLGIERLILTLESLNLPLGEDYKPDLYIASIGDKCKTQAFVIANKLRKKSLVVETDLMDRSLKSQMKYANKLDAKYLIVLGDNELKEKKVNIKNMETGKERKIEIKNIGEYIIKKRK